MQEVVVNHQKAIELSMKQSRKNNVIISGIEEVAEEKIIEVVQQLFQSNLNVEGVEIVKAMRLGRPQRQARLVLVMLGSFNDKLRVMKNKRYLKGSSILYKMIVPQNRGGSSKSYGNSVLEQGRRES